MNVSRSAHLSKVGLAMALAGIACFLYVWFATPMAAIDAMENGGADAPGMRDVELAAALAAPILFVMGLVLLLVGRVRR